MLLVILQLTQRKTYLDICRNSAVDAKKKHILTFAETLQE